MGHKKNMEISEKELNQKEEKGIECQSTVI
jgi:hypothetical protein